jgi:hypothetical protein
MRLRQQLEQPRRQTRWDPVVISTSEIKPGEPGYYYHEGPEVSVSTVMVDGVEVVVEDDPPLDFGGNPT